MARAATVRIDAVVDDDLTHVRGRMVLEGADPSALVDPLVGMPLPRDDQTRFRTFPGRDAVGHVTWHDQPDGSIAFEAELPRRFGDRGATAHGLFANGGWHPQLEGLPVVDWVVDIAMPPHTTAALADRVGTGQVHWEGRADRASLAVVPHGVVTELVHGRLLTRRTPSKRLVRELDTDLVAWPVPLDGVVVRAPLRRRLVRPGAGLAYLSTRAHRLTPGLAFAHRVPVGRGLGAAWSGAPDPFVRELVGAGLSPEHVQALDAADTRKLLGSFAWVPQVQSLLSSRRLPFYSDILDLTWPGDPLRDDLAEQLRPSVPGTVAAARLDDRFGPGTATEVAHALHDGRPLPDALPDVPGLAASLRAMPPVQDYRLEVDADHVRLTRLAPAPSAPEVVVLRIDGEDRTLFVPPGVTEVPLVEPADRVVFDPGQHLLQPRVGDTWPPRYTLTASGWISTLNLSRRQLYGTLWTSLRRQYDTRHLWSGTLSNSRTDLVRAGMGHTWKVGPLIDGLTRRHAVRLGGSASLLDPRFAATDGLRVATDLSLAWAFDDRVSNEFPTSGERFAASVHGGIVPGTDERWAGTGGSITLLGGLHPRVVVATRLAAHMARSTVPHRLLALGGQGAMRSIPVLPACPTADGSPCADLATERAVLYLEYRWAPIRNWSVPMGLAWGTELQLTGGLETLLARVDDAPVMATGLTGGVLGVADVLGAEPTSLGVTLGWPVKATGIDLRPSPWPEIYLRMGQAF